MGNNCGKMTISVMHCKNVLIPRVKYKISKFFSEICIVNDIDDHRSPPSTPKNLSKSMANDDVNINIRKRSDENSQELQYPQSPDKLPEEVSKREPDENREIEININIASETINIPESDTTIKKVYICAPKKNESDSDDSFLFIDDDVN